MSVLGHNSELLWQHCLAGDVTGINAATQAGANALHRDRNGETCLHMSARSGEVKAVTRMLEAGVEVNGVNHNGQSPLHVAVNKDHVDVVKFLLQQRADPDLTTSFSGMTSLHMACRDNNTKMVKCLLDLGADCAIRDKISKYPDFYTTDKKVLDVFDLHFPVCTHGRRPQQSSGQDKPSTQGQGAKFTRSRPSQSSIQMADVKTSEATATEDSKVLKDRTVKERQAPQYGNIQHQGKGIYDKMEHYNAEGNTEMLDLKRGDQTEIYNKMEMYDVVKAKENFDLEQRDAKKVKVNHGFDFSDEHKQRMRKPVWERLADKSKADKAKKEAAKK